MKNVRERFISMGVIFIFSRTMIFIKITCCNSALMKDIVPTVYQL